MHDSKQQMIWECREIVRKREKKRAEKNSVENKKENRIVRSTQIRMMYSELTLSIKWMCVFLVGNIGVNTTSERVCAYTKHHISSHVIWVCHTYMYDEYNTDGCGSYFTRFSHIEDINFMRSFVSYKEIASVSLWHEKITFLQWTCTAKGYFLHMCVCVCVIMV